MVWGWDEELVGCLAGSGDPLELESLFWLQRLTGKGQVDAESTWAQENCLSG